MNEGKISKRYARALLRYAVEQGTEDAIYSEMKILASVFQQTAKLRMAMNNPMLKMKVKFDLIKAVLDNKPSDALVRLAQLVLKNRREMYFMHIALSYGDLYREYKNINVGTLVTATPVDSVTIEKMKLLMQQIKPGTLDFEQKVDPKIEGGFVLYIDTYRLDASVVSQLKRIKQQLFIENSKRS